MYIPLWGAWFSNGSDSLQVVTPSSMPSLYERLCSSIDLALSPVKQNLPRPTVSNTPLATGLPLRRTPLSEGPQPPLRERLYQHMSATWSPIRVAARAIQATPSSEAASGSWLPSATSSTVYSRVASALNFSPLKVRAPAFVGSSSDTGPPPCKRARMAALERPSVVITEPPSYIPSSSEDGPESDLDDEDGRAVDDCVAAGLSKSMRDGEKSAWKSWSVACAEHGIKPWRPGTSSSARRQHKEMRKMCRVVITMYKNMVPRCHSDPAPKPDSAKKIYIHVHRKHRRAGIEIPPSRCSGTGHQRLGATVH